MQMDFLNAVPASPENPPINFKLDKSQEEFSQTYSIAIHNPGDAQGMLISRLSVSSCYDIDMNQLEILKDRALIDNFEISSDKTMITLYWTYMNKNEVKNVSLNLAKKFGHSDDSIC